MKDYRSIRHCFYCGRGLSNKYRNTPEDALLLAIFNRAAGSCNICSKKYLKQIEKEKS
jgi:hypothetical protein